jgi:two-component system, NtrC family, response regulator AlgB
VDALEDQVRSIVPEAYLRTEDAAMQQELDVAFRAADSHATILILGESGTGKGVLARAIHAHSPQAQAPFVTIHCPSLSAELLESELFGHVRGAFTGAVQDTLGKVHVASGGILFLDEIGDLPLGLQPKLLRLLQEKRYERVGENLTRTANVRVLAATNRNLEADVAAGSFREDLFYRLNVISVTPVPLRRRKVDIRPLASHLLAFFARESGKSITGFTPEAEAAIADCTWPGNIREMRNAIERAVILALGPTIGVADLSQQVLKPVQESIALGAPVTLEQLEAEHIRRILASVPTLEEAASILGINPSTLFRRRKRSL